MTKDKPVTEESDSAVLAKGSSMPYNFITGDRIRSENLRWKASVPGAESREVPESAEKRRK